MCVNRPSRSEPTTPQYPCLLLVDHCDSWSQRVSVPLIPTSYSQRCGEVYSSSFSGSDRDLSRHSLRPRTIRLRRSVSRDPGSPERTPKVWDKVVVNDPVDPADEVERSGTGRGRVGTVGGSLFVSSEGFVTLRGLPTTMCKGNFSRLLISCLNGVSTSLWDKVRTYRNCYKDGSLAGNR